MAKKDDNKRFEKVYDQSGWAGSMYVWRDRVTGVHYLVATAGQGGGITPLLDENGKPIIFKGDYGADE